MSKDPAFLFYYQDFFTGVSDLNNEQVGAYIRCLCTQASKGGIKESHMKNICITHECYEAVREKFKIDELTNLLYNERLKNEIIKRQNYSESRRNNRLKSKDMNNISKTYVKHMENENENKIVNKNINKIKKNIIPTFDEVLKHAQSVEPLVDPVSVKYKYHQWVDAGWCTTKNDKPKPIKNWQLTISRCMKYFNKINTTFTAPKINQYYEET